MPDHCARTSPVPTLAGDEEDVYELARRDWSAAPDTPSR